jgi:hypothetical protein
MHRVAAALLAIGFLATGGLAVSAAPVAAADFPAKDSKYHTYTEMAAFLDAEVAKAPAIIRKFSIGKSYAGRDIWAVKISDRVATDEAEPEVMFDGLHHAREHLSAEMNIELIRWLVDGYATDGRIRHIVDTREIYVIPMVNPDGGQYDLTGNPYRAWRKNRQPNSGTTAVGTDLNRNYRYRWACCGGSSSSKGSDTYHGSKALSAPEAAAVAHFMDSRVIAGRQQLKAAITFHTAGQQILWPYGYTRTDVPSDMTTDDHAALVALGKKMATMNGYKPMQSSSLYITDGDEIDDAYGLHHIFMYTFEMYPSGVTSLSRFYPADEKIAPETIRNKEAVLYLLEQAGCLYAITGKAQANCGPMYDDLEIPSGWLTNRWGLDQATAGTWQRANPSSTGKQLGTTVSGSKAFVTGAAAGDSASANDLDGGPTTISSPLTTVSNPAGNLTFKYSFAHGTNSSTADYFRVYVMRPDGSKTLVKQELGGTESDAPGWTSVSVSLAPWAGERVRIVFEAADLAPFSLVEAEVDDVRITRP